MILIAELVIILVLIVSLIVFMIEEGKIKESKVPRGAVREYWNGRERRGAFRINTSLIVKYSIEKKHHIKLNGRVKDLSTSGMKLLVTEKLSEGIFLLLEFDIPGLKNAIAADGKVIWSKGSFSDRDEIGRRVFQTGIQFMNIKPDDKNRLTAYIEEIAEKA